MCMIEHVALYMHGVRISLIEENICLPSEFVSPKQDKNM